MLTETDAWLAPFPTAENARAPSAVWPVTLASSSTSMAQAVSPVLFPTVKFVKEIIFVRDVLLGIN